MTPIASGSGTQQLTSWNSLQNGEDLDGFFDQLLQRSRSRRLGMRPITAKDFTDDSSCISSLPGADEFPLWRIGCRVHI